MTNELLCLILDDYLIYADSQPQSPLYELSSPPTVGRSGPYAVEKFIYRLSTNDGEGAVRKRKRHLYDFRSDSSVDSLKECVSVDSKAASKLTFSDVKLYAPAGTAWPTCKAEPHFKIGQSIRNRLGSNKYELEWKDWEGNVVAVEKKTLRKSDNSVERPPRLEVQAALGMKKLDLLVALWGARVWKETLKETAEPFNWAKCESILSAQRGCQELR